MGSECAGGHAGPPLHLSCGPAVWRPPATSDRVVRAATQGRPYMYRVAAPGDIGSR